MAPCHGDRSRRRFPGRPASVSHGSLGRGGSIVLVSSASGIKAARFQRLCGEQSRPAFVSPVGCPGVRQRRHSHQHNSSGRSRTPMWTATDFWQRVVTEHGGDKKAAWRTLAATTPLKRFTEPDEMANPSCTSHRTPLPSPQVPNWSSMVASRREQGEGRTKLETASALCRT